MVIIGGYPAASICDVNNYKSALRLAMELRDEVASEIVEGEPVEWGLRFERPILDKYEESESCRLEYCQKEFYHPIYPYMRAKPDGYNSIIKAIVDAKNLNGHVLKEWQTNGMSYLYLTQQHYYSAIMQSCGVEIDQIHIAAVFGGQHYECFKIPYDDELGQIIINKVKTFYEKYIINLEPLDDLINNSQCSDLESYYKKANGTEIALDDDHVGHALREYLRLKEEIKERDEALRANKAVIEAAMAEASKAVWTNGNEAIAVSWGNTTKKSFDTTLFKSENPELYDKYMHETTYRVMRVTEKNLTKKIKGEVNE
jgi:predicted phage-related endonuclease